MTIDQRQVRALRTDDLPGCLALTAEHGWPYTERRWSFLFRNGEPYGIDDPAGGLAGTVLLTRYGPDLAAVGMMLVAGRHARQGLGRTLLHHVIDAAGDATLFLYATEHGRPLYAKLGFRTTAEVNTLRGEFRPDTVPDLTRAARPADLDAIARLDAEVFGADRSTLLAALLGFADGMRVIERDGRIAGFAAATPAGESTVIGPLIAERDTDARALIGALATRPGVRAVRVDLDTARTGLTGWLADRGLGPTGATSFMVRGNPDLPGDRSRMYLPVLTALG